MCIISVVGMVLAYSFAHRIMNETDSLPTFSTARVLVVGDAMLDRYWHGETSRISPEAPVPVVRINGDETRAGGAANVATNITALGAKCSLVALVGDDADSRTLENILQTHGVDNHLARFSDRPTLCKLRIISRQQQLLRIDWEEPLLSDDTQAVSDKFLATLDQADAVVLSDYGKGTLCHVDQLIAAAKSKDLPVLVDPKGTDFSRYRGATLITPNLAEFQAVVGPCHGAAEIEQKARLLAQQYDFGAVLVTRGEAGMSLVPHNDTALHLATRAREVFDVTGAGDTVIGTLAASLAAGATLPRAMALANQAAGIVVGKLGTAVVSPQELLSNAAANAPATGIVSEPELLQHVKQSRHAGEHIVMTNGCFDILHAGHVAYLNEAARLGDRLIVAVNTDATVRALKGRDRPVNKLQDRMAVLASLGCVDWVVPFIEPTPERLIEEVLPDVLSKGGDNDPDRIPGAAVVRAAGGRVVVAGFLAGRSTTDIVRRVRETHDEN